jgi:hypothetical protein
MCIAQLRQNANTSLDCLSGHRLTAAKPVERLPSQQKRTRSLARPKHSPRIISHLSQVGTVPIEGVWAALPASYSARDR